MGYRQFGSTRFCTYRYNSSTHETMKFRIRYLDKYGKKWNNEAVKDINIYQIKSGDPSNLCKDCRFCLYVELIGNEKFPADAFCALSRDAFPTGNCSDWACRTEVTM